MTNTMTPDVWEGIRARHSTVESAGQPTEAARAMAYLSHLDRRDLIAEVERLQRDLRDLKAGDERIFERLQGLLKVAACPNWSAAGHEGAWQCQWCDERKSALSGAAEPVNHDN